MTYRALLTIIKAHIMKWAVIAIEDKDFAKNRRLLIIHIAVGAVAAGAAALFFALGFCAPQCYVYALTGRVCIACGSTRSVFQLLRLRPLAAILYNPMPVVAAGYWVYVVLREALILILHRGSSPGRRSLIIALSIMVLCGAAYYVLRMCGVALLPQQLDALL